MMTPTFRHLTLDELMARGWRLSDPRQADDGTWFVTLGLFVDRDMAHAVTGQGETAEAARTKATELANRWRERKAAERMGERRVLSYASPA